MFREDATRLPSTVRADTCANLTLSRVRFGVKQRKVGAEGVVEDEYGARLQADHGKSPGFQVLFATPRARR
jgi:hypothetical protein